MCFLKLSRNWFAVTVVEFSRYVKSDSWRHIRTAEPGRCCPLTSSASLEIFF